MVESGGGRPKEYRTTDGTKVPGTTTIVGRFKPAGGLIHWSWNLGMQGIDYRKARDEAADAGTIAHELIDADIMGREPDVAGAAPDLLRLATKGFEAFLRWKEQTRLKVVVTELPIVSDSMLYGGTLDAIFELDNRLVLGDWKSGSRIYGEFIVQMGAYSRLWEERYPDRPLTGVDLLRVGKEYGDFHHHSWPREVLDLGWKAFRLERARYELDAPLKRAVG